MAFPAAQAGSPSSTTLEPWMLVASLLLLVLGLTGYVLWQRRDGIDLAGTAGAAPIPGAASTDPPAEPSVSDEELLPDEERVVTLLEDSGGRMRQSAIVDATDWSKSKVSMLLSDMESEEAVSRLRVGRENIVSLPGYEPEATRSPYEK